MKVDFLLGIADNKPVHVIGDWEKHCLRRPCDHGVEFRRGDVQEEPAGASEPAAHGQYQAVPAEDTSASGRFDPQ
ncbi:hypothetical protein HY374_02500 [Candidatus Berkelbacteria bacterium]|nr:hypothetical protein [Candidatus Berkelbacteria bacterium]